MSLCAICLDPEINSPAACVPCGHTFCHPCILQWTRNAPRFGISLCPQCRSPVRKVQKLFISDWPVTGSAGGPVLTQLTAWQQFGHLMTLLVHFLSIPFDSLTRYGPELGRQLTVWVNQQAERLLALQARLIYWAGVWRREWQDLGWQAQCLVGAAALLMLLLLVQDLQDKDGIHRGVVLPILLLVADIMRQTLFLAAYLLGRPLTCLLRCGLEVGLAAADVGSSAAWWAGRVAWDVACVPWLAACVLARLLCWALSLVAGVVRVVMLCLLLVLSLGLPVFMASASSSAADAAAADAGDRRHAGEGAGRPPQLPLLLLFPPPVQAWGERLGQLILRWSQQAALRLQQQQQQQQLQQQEQQQEEQQQEQPGGAVGGVPQQAEAGIHREMVSGFFRAVSQELNVLLNNNGEGEGDRGQGREEEEEEAVQGGGGRGGGGGGGRGSGGGAGGPGSV